MEHLKEITHLRKSEGLNFAAIRTQLWAAEGADEESAVRSGERPRRLTRRSHKTLREVSETTGL